ncbi:EthD family reductase [Peribacillus glennii]|uniref:EthD family reductase n=1 Tax=Peribacillus glennii TaxID=2303991 RepID=A0A372L795_9BACI|nr:EthD family reductase [Peribacillus glennii]RFU61091.1 EthD family reductase [Peribacillus glennii]
MVKMTVIYEQPKDKEGFENHYYDVHIPLVQKLPNLKNLSYQNVLQTQNTEADLYLMAQLEFENMEAFQESMASEIGQEAQNDVGNLVKFLNKPPVILISQ